jgi:threonine aldolase
VSRRGFASDNAAGVHPAVLEAITRVNEGHAFGYGHDRFTQHVEAMFAEVFGTGTQTFLVWGGTAANVLSLRSACRSWDAVICADTAHLNVDECGAPESIGGLKLLTAPNQGGKLTAAAIERMIVRVGDEHAVQPRVVSISQCTELGTVYSLTELSEISELAHRNGLLLHLDGARLSNAAAALGVGLAELTRGSGVDILSFGGTKNGLLGAEAVVVLNPALADGFLFLRKQSMQLASKMRFLAAQFEALLTGELWRECASRANAMAARLAAAVTDLPGLEVTRPVQANAVFARLPAAVIAALQEQFDFYIWDELAGEVRWICAWDTTEDDVDAFAAAVATAL